MPPRTTSVFRACEINSGVRRWSLLAFLHFRGRAGVGFYEQGQVRVSCMSQTDRWQQLGGFVLKLLIGGSWPTRPSYPMSLVGRVMANVANLYQFTSLTLPPSHRLPSLPISRASPQPSPAFFLTLRCHE